MSSEPTRILQHLVSRGYQQNFAAGNALSVVQVRTADLIEARRPTKTNWRVADFLSVVNEEGEPDDALEREFADDERVILNRIRDIRAFKKVTKEQKRAVDILTAIHLVRSRSYEDRHGEVATEWLTNQAQEIAYSPELVAEFERSQGRKPRPGELEAVVAQRAAVRLEDPTLFPDGVRHGASRLGQLFSTWHLQLIEIDSDLPGLVLADHPIVHGRVQLGVLGFAAGAVGQSDTVIVPITRRLAGSYMRTPASDRKIVTKKGLDWINSLFIRGARDEVACHPEDASATRRLIRNLDRYPPERFNQTALQ